ncbi:MAG: hypothetical protein WBI96_05625 [Candidatus Hydrothermia bacterium]
MATIRRLFFYVALILILLLSTLRILSLRLANEQKKLTLLTPVIDSCYSELELTMNEVVKSIQKVHRDEPVKDTFLLGYSWFVMKKDTSFYNAVSAHDYEKALYSMNKKSSDFFRLINYVWEEIQGFETNAGFTQRLNRINEIELTIDSLLTEAKKTTERIKRYSGLYELLWPF